MTYFNVKGGTHAGWRRIYDQHPWDCTGCGRHNEKYLNNCLGCGARKPLVAKA